MSGVAFVGFIGVLECGSENVPRVSQQVISERRRKVSIDCIWHIYTPIKHTPLGRLVIETFPESIRLFEVTLAGFQVGTMHGMKVDETLKVLFKGFAHLLKSIEDTSMNCCNGIGSMVLSISITGTCQSHPRLIGAFFRFDSDFIRGKAHFEVKGVKVCDCIIFRAKGFSIHPAAANTRR